MTSLSKILTVIRIASHIQKLNQQWKGSSVWTVGELAEFAPFSKSTLQKTLKMMREKDIVTFEEIPYKNTIAYMYRVSDHVRAEWLGEELF